MNEVNEIVNNESGGLLKKKNPRPPQSQKQKDAFQKAAAKRAENIQSRKENKILEAQKALLEKEGYVKKEVKDKPSNKEKEPVIQFQIEEEESDEEQEPIQKPIIKKLPREKPIPEKKSNIKKEVPKPKIKKEPQVIIESGSSDDSSNSSSDEEVIIIKRSKKSKVNTKPSKKIKEPEESEYEEEYVAQKDWSSFFN